MRLAELSPAELAYLQSPLPRVDNWSPRLGKHLSRILSARMKCSVQLVPITPARSEEGLRDTPQIHVDDALIALWVRARLGGPLRVGTRCSALSRNLQATMQRCIAEAWLSSPSELLPKTLCWRVEVPAPGGATATLTLHFPDTYQQMHAWAQRVVAS